MHLVVFDLDGTLLNDVSELTSFTKETLLLLDENEIAYTVATGRTMVSAKSILSDHEFTLPQIYNNGVTVWDPRSKKLTLENLLENSEIDSILQVAASAGIAPFIHSLDSEHHYIYHGDLYHEIEVRLVKKHFSLTKAKLFPIETLPQNCDVTNISMIGEAEVVTEMWQKINAQPNLVAYSGPALEGKEYRWMDVHHRLASKGSAVSVLKKELGVSNVICFGDSDNDLSMFELADEAYAPENAKPDIKKSANAVIGHNHEDGIAHFLRERFSL